MIAVTIDGRLGNQLFQYAFGLWLAKQWNTTLVIWHREQQYQLEKYFRLSFKVRFFTALGRLLGRALVQVERLNLMSDVDCLAFVERVNASQEPIRNLVIDGFFQSQKCFLGIEDQVRQSFRLKARYLRRPVRQYELAFHVRRGDYKEFLLDPETGLSGVLPASYYQRAMESLNLGPVSCCVVVQDKREISPDEFAFLGDYDLVSSDMIEDFRVLMAARHLVISNSSFAWWAAFLGQNHKVIGPRYWFGIQKRQESPVGIMTSPFDWIDAL